MAVKFNPFSGSFDLVGDKAISQVLTGYTSGAGTVSATDTILQAIQKLNGNDALKADLAGATFTGNVILSSTTASTSTTSGALQVAGGAGIQGKVFIGGDVFILEGLNTGVPLAIRGFGTGGSYTQTGDLQKWQSYDGTTATDLIRIDSSGALAGANKSGTDSPGGSLTLKAGAGTGAGAISQIAFQTPTLGSSGSTSQSLATRATLDSSGLTLAVNLAMGSKDITNAANITMGGTLTLGSSSTIQSNTSATNTLTIKTANAGTSGALTLTTGDTAGTSGYVRIGVGTGTAGKGAVIIGSNSLSAVFRSTNGGSDITPQILIDPANSLTSGNAYSFNTAQGFGFTRANGTRRILRWSALLTSNVDTAGSESSDLIWAPLNVTDKFIIGGALNLNQYTGTGTAAAEIDSNGNVVRGDSIDSMTISDATIITQLTTGGNWTGTPKAYTGSAISGAKQGQFYDDGTYLYLFVDNVTPKRLAYA